MDRVRLPGSEDQPSQSRRSLVDRGNSVPYNDALRAPSWPELKQAYARLAESRFPYTRIERFQVLNELSRGANIYLAIENAQRTKSFKIRAALLELSHLSPETRVVIASSGNQALAFAHEAQKRGIPLVAVIPESAPTTKVESVRASGAMLIQHGSTYDEAYLYAKQYAKQHTSTFMDVSSHESVAALSTVVWEMLEQVPYADAVILPAGGGTLLAGGAWVAKEHAKMQQRELLVIGAVAEGASTTYESFKRRELTRVTDPDTIADATRVEVMDAHLFPLIVDHVDDMVKIPEEQIKEGIVLLSQLTEKPVEGAGALGTMAVVGNGGVIRGVRGDEIDLRGKTVLTVITGGNIGPDKVDELRTESIRRGRYVKHSAEQ